MSVNERAYVYAYLQECMGKFSLSLRLYTVPVDCTECILTRAIHERMQRLVSCMILILYAISAAESLRLVKQFDAI